MKQQKFSDSELCDLVAGKVVVMVEAKKKGDGLLGEKHFLQMFNNQTGKSCRVGEVVRAVNEKGADVYFCSRCKEIYTIIPYCPVYCSCLETDTGMQGGRKTEPLLVVLEKIEESRNDTTPFGRNRVYGGQLPESMWLKSWRRKK